MKLEGKIAVVTGGASGLGKGICQSLAREGADIVIGDIQEALAKTAIKEIGETGVTCKALKTDVKKTMECKALVEFAVNLFGHIDFLVCCAGGGRDYDAPAPDIEDLVKRDYNAIENLPEEVFDHIVDLNFKGVFLSIQAAVPYFKKQKYGRIITISSVAGRRGVNAGAGLMTYSAAKAAVILMTQSVACEMAPYHVNVNAICPGIIWTPSWAENALLLSKTVPAFKGMTPEDVFTIVAKHEIPFGNPQSPEDIGNMAVFLCSDDAKEITGQAFNVDGGMRMN
ncbi:MAG: SDR family oxidoreductase [Deltaproteobacteria bacterium]|nr:SDR family oxidoreductase [Deltaproteobacteria bacterium]